MPRFHDPQRRLLVTTNMKVLFSTLCDQEHLEQLGEPRFARQVLLGGRHRHVMFARNPYDRLVSAYVDKFETHPRLLGTPGFKGWQSFQRRFLRSFGVPRDAPAEKIQEVLLGTTFEQFIGELPRLFWRDTHLRPQNYMMSLSIKRVVRILPLRIDELIRIEEMDHDRIRNELGLELASIKHNATSHGPAEEYFTSPLRTIVNGVYRKDFERLGYEPRH